MSKLWLNWGGGGGGGGGEGEHKSMIVDLVPYNHKLILVLANVLSQNRSFSSRTTWKMQRIGGKLKGAVIMLKCMS